LIASFHPPFYFVRHGQSEANVLRVISNRGRIHPLTAKGIDQAQQLAETLKNLHSPRLFSSPLLRATQTAEILAHALHVEFTITDALREYDCGDLEGQSDASAWEAHRDLKDAWIFRQEWQLRRPGGESFIDIRARFEPFVNNILREDDPRPVVMVGHGGTYQCMLPLILHNIGFDEVLNLPFPNTGLVLAQPVSHGLVCRDWCGIPKD